MPDLRTIDADFRRWFGEAYRPLCFTRIPDGELCIGEPPRVVGGSVGEAFVYAAGAQAWANTTETVMAHTPPSKEKRPYRVHVGGHIYDFESLTTLHAAVKAWHERTVKP